MAKYTVQCSDCSTEMQVSLFGPNKDREWKLEKLDWVCDDCKAKRLLAQGRAAAEKTADLGLPELTGTEKQIAWANQIRAAAYEKRIAIRSSALRDADFELKNDPGCDWMFDQQTVEGGGRFKSQQIVKKLKAEVLAALEPMRDQIISDTESRFFGVESARWWIDNRDDLSGAFAKSIAKTIKLMQSPKAPATAEAAEAKAESMLAPEGELSSQAVCEITVSETGVTVDLPVKIEAFRMMVKNAGFSWESGAWKCKSSSRREERAAWVGFNALAMGIRVVVHHDEVREAIKTGNVKGQWVALNKDNTRFLLSWWAGDWYDTCRKLPGARWDKPFMTVPVRYAAEVADFAATERWGITPAAQRMIDSGVKTETVAVNLPDQNPQDRPTLKADNFGVSDGLRD